MSKEKPLQLLNDKAEIRKAILSAEDIITQVVDVPEWGLQVRVRGLTGKQIDQWQGSLFKVKGDDVEMKMQNSRAKLVAMCIVDANGKRVFNDGADVFDLGDKSSKAIKRIYEVARVLSGISEDALDEIEENFPGDLNGSSISD